MGYRSKKGEMGFTIIETMLFLAISGFLAVMVISAFGLGIRQQQYRDMTTNMKGFLQRQYTNTSNVFNDRMPTNQCPGATSVYRGRTDCLLIGRYITTDANGANFQAGNIIASEKPGVITVSSSDDTTALRNFYNYTTISNASGANNAPYQFEEMDFGGMGFVKPDRTGRMPITIAIIRGPQSGDIITYVVPNVSYAPMAQVLANTSLAYSSYPTATNAYGQILCVAYNINSPQGFKIFEPTRVPIQIKPYASGPSSIEVLANESAGSGDPRRCGN